jgi:hypothetical protein
VVRGLKKIYNPLYKQYFLFVIMNMNPGIARMSALLIILTLFLLILAPFTSTIARAEVTELKVTPQVIDPGDTVSITGKASPNEAVWLRSSFELPLTVSEGEYSREFNNIHFPRGEKEFSVTAENVKNVRASLYPIFWQRIEYPLEGPLNATNDIATLSVSFPATWHGITIDIYGEKQVKIYGDAAEGATSVNLNVIMSIKVSADSKGDFKLDLNTEGVPEGEFLISAGGEEETVYIGVTPPPTSTPTPSPSPSPIPSPTPTPTKSSNGIPETTPTPTSATPENVTQNETATPSPTLIPTPSPASATAPPTTPLKPDTSENTPSPPPQDNTNQSPQNTTEPSPIPGFELVGGIAALFISSILKRVTGRK